MRGLSASIVVLNTLRGTRHVVMLSPAAQGTSVTDC